MSLTRQDVEKVALLSRLRLTNDEAEALTQQLGQVLTYIQQLEELDTSQVEPLAHPLDLENVLVDDQRGGGLDRTQALSAAPKHDEEYFLVPAVLGD